MGRAGREAGPPASSYSARRPYGTLFVRTWRRPRTPSRFSGRRWVPPGPVAIKVESLTFLVTLVKKPKTLSPLPTNPDVHQFLAHHIDRSDLTHREIARACGFGRPNMVSMIKTGDCRLPLERLGAMADTLHVDPFALFKLWMKSYYPETWDLLWHHIRSRRRPLPRLPGLSPSRDLE